MPPPAPDPAARPVSGGPEVPEPLSGVRRAVSTGLEAAGEAGAGEAATGAGVTGTGVTGAGVAAACVDDPGLGAAGAEVPEAEEAPSPAAGRVGTTGRGAGAGVDATGVSGRG
ncbi:hypothetical protein ACFSC4_15455 [Deinococcus malanensis]|uniref:hypothetical protein n=1 Tax=Deinococcus malanensis TaxID=1706855 RepID=UPI00166E8DA2|nr:hypothetical protein [Deinococcus malanensis]